MKVIGSAKTLEELTKMFNDKYFSINWVVREDNGVLKFYNTKLEKFASGFIRNKKDRFQYCDEV
jgi:hypothetical protein